MSTPIDARHLAAGLRLPIPAGHYADQPYVVTNEDGSWTCVVTTGRGREGQPGQHVVSLISADLGRSWEGPFDIEPADGPEASWALPLRVPETGRIYVFYTYNAANRREVQCVDGSTIARVDSFGAFAYRFSDDRGRTWSDRRYEIPMRPFEIDRRNAYGGEVLFFWGLGKPFIHDGAAYLCASKVGGFGPGFFVENEGVLFRSPNLLTEHDPSNHEWETLPEGDIGIRTPDGGGPIAGELKALPMNDGALYATYRTIDGYACHAYSRDGGRTWERDWMRFTPGGRKVKNPRAANFAWRCSNGNYVYWFEFHGGEPLARAGVQDPGVGYSHRNPAWLLGGVERDGRIHWSQPEIILFDDDLGVRFSYPDFIEQDGRTFITETQKEIARVHEIDPTLLEGMWRQGEDREVVGDGLLVEHTGGGTLVMPELPRLHARGRGPVDPATGQAPVGGAEPTARRGGFALDLWLTFRDLAPWQIVFDSRDEEGRGILAQVTDRGTLSLSLYGRTCVEPGSRWSGGLTWSTWDCDPGLLEAGRRHHVVFIVDGGPKIITVLVDGVLCDGGPTRQYGWGRFHPDLKEANGAAEARVAPSMNGVVERLRIYGRYLRTSEAVANFHAGPGAAFRNTPGKPGGERG